VNFEKHKEEDNVRKRMKKLECQEYQSSWLQDMQMQQDPISVLPLLESEDLEGEEREDED